MAKKKIVHDVEMPAKEKVKFSTQDFDKMIYDDSCASCSKEAAKAERFYLSRPMQDAMQLTLDVEGIAKASIWMADHTVKCPEDATGEEEQFSIRLAPAQLDNVILVNIRCSICGEEYTAGVIACK